MYAKVEKPKEKKSRAVANFNCQNSGDKKQGLGFADNRPEAINQRKVQVIINTGVPTSLIQRLYDAGSGQYIGDRPKKPGSLKGKDENDQALTAHHIYPWNKIRDDINNALSDKNKSQMQAILNFAAVTVDDSFWEDLAKETAARSPSFGTEINRIAKAACWNKSNIFMGPLGEYRSDDPGEEMDMSFSKSGLPTPASAVGDLTRQSGGIGKRSKLAKLLAVNVAEATGGEAEAYDSDKWNSTSGFIGKGAKKRSATIRFRKGKIPIPQNKVTLNMVDDAIKTDNRALLELWFYSPQFPLETWEMEAWSKFLDWNSKPDL